MKTFFALAIALGCNWAFANNIDCQHVGIIEFDGDTAFINYSSEMGFGPVDQSDEASFVSMDANQSVYEANKWGASITIPNALISYQVQFANVTFATQDDPYRVEICSQIPDEGPCAMQIQTTVDAWADSDFPGQSLRAVLPTIDESGGSVNFYDVPVVSRSNPNNEIGTYRVLVNEVCAINRQSMSR